MSKAFCRLGNGTTKDIAQAYTHPTSQQCLSVNVSAATGILPVTRGGTGVTSINALKNLLGLSTGGGSQIEMYPIGGIVKFDNKFWLAAHYDDAKGLLYLVSRYVVSITQFSSGSTAYAGSTLAQVAANYQSTQMSSTALSYCANVTVNGVTAKVFVPSYDQMKFGFRCFDSDLSRIAYYNGTLQDYWTSTASMSPSVWCVYDDGSLYSHYYANTSHGFRPAIALQM